MHTKIPILSQTRDQFAQQIRDCLGKGFEHASIIYSEWFKKGQVSDSNLAFNNAKALYQDILSVTDFSVLPSVSSLQEGETGKFLLKTADHLEIESVLIPMQAGGTLCVSSQVGCRMGCSFCETGRMGLLRNLKPEEIISQVFAAKFTFNFNLRNIVFMGMGEPFDNYDSVMQAVRVLNDSFGFGIGVNHITISTSGVCEGIERLMAEKGPTPNLAVSINAPNDELRNKLMPINRKTNLQGLYETMQKYCSQTGKQILVAYVLLKGINDALDHADELAKYLQGLDIKINVIPYNPQSRDRYQPPEQSVIESFTERLRQHGYYTLLRQTKGRQIMAACGQLGNLKLRTQFLSNNN